MLSYSVKLNDNNIKKDEVVWGEKYLSPDLLFVTGVTSQDYHLEKLNQIEATIDNKSDILNIQAENVTREGYVIVKGKKYPVIDGTVFINGKYYYVNNNKIVIDNWLVEKYTKKEDYNNDTSAYTDTYFTPNVTTDTITATVSGGDVSIDTIYWIENDKVIIDGNEYFFDKNEAGGGLKYFEDGQCLTPSEITDCSNIEYNVIEKAKDFINVTKFTLSKNKEREVNINDISFISHFTFIKYNNNYYPIELSGNNYICKIGNSTYTAYTDDKTDSALTSSNVTDYENLSELGVFIKFGEEKLYAENMVQNANDGRKIGFYLSDTYDNIKTGDIITARKKGTFEQEIAVEKISGSPFVLYDGVRYEIYPNMIKTVTINGEEYNIIKCDDTNCYVDIEGEEVPMINSGDTLEKYGLIVRPITSGESIEHNSQLPGAVEEGDDTPADYEARVGRAASGETLTEKEANLYNETLTGAIHEGQVMPAKGIYDVNHYSGVTISGIDYKVLETEPEDDDDKPLNFILIETGVAHRLKVIETIGNSLIVCEPDFDENEFSDEYIKDKKYAICNEIISNNVLYHYYIKNHIFGEREVLPGNGKLYNSGATSTDDYQDVLDSLKLYTNTGYILLPINLEAGAEINMLLDDVREKDFIELETEKAINPIVDMERDVYVPKFIVNESDSIFAYSAACDTIARANFSDLTDEERSHTYIGSYTDFKPIREIQFNFHFRTRDSISWKVNEEYNDISTSATCNWFITDYEPYKSIISGGSGNDLMDVSDTLGVLYYNNMDVFYQKKSLEKSFARLSYYDDIDSQKQSLLHTSSVFINEHNLFKKFIDNSRKNIDDYMLVQEPSIEEHGGTTGGKVYEKHPSIVGKISVSTEYIGKHNPRKIKPDDSGYKFTDADVTNEDKRLSSRLSIVNKYETDTSSEGFYLYIFKQYAENLHTKPIYMKVDFNHAKIGKTIPFVVPMKWSGATTSDYVYPISGLTIGNADDLKEMKEGIPLSYLYGQLYIPIYAMYDFKNKEYAYIFDNRYVKVTEDGIAKINLFEVKVKNDESIFGTTTTAVIDINSKQISVK